MILFPVPVYMIKETIHDRKVLKCANKACHKVMGEGLKDTIKTADKIGLINLKFMKWYWKWFKKLYF